MLLATLASMNELGVAARACAAPASLAAVVASMGEHPAVRKFAIMLLATVARIPGGFGAHADTPGLVAAITAALGGAAGDALMVQLGLDVLAALGRSDGAGRSTVFATASNAAAANAAVTAALRGHPSVAVQTAATSARAALEAAAAAHAGAVAAPPSPVEPADAQTQLRAALGVMAGGVGVEAVQVRGLSALAAIVDDNSAAAKVLDTEPGALQAVLAALAAHRGTVAVQRAGLEVVLALTGLTDASDDATYAGHVGTPGAVVGVVAACVAGLLAYSRDREVQRCGLCALFAVTHPNSNASAAYVQQVATTALPAVVAAMTNFPGVPPAQQTSLGVLANLVVATADSDAAPRVAGNAAVLPAVVAAMQALPGNTVVQERGVAVLKGLAAQPGVGLLHTDGAIAAVTAAMLASRDHVHVQADGIMALLTCVRTTPPDVWLATLREHGAAVAVVSAMNVIAGGDQWGNMHEQLGLQLLSKLHAASRVHLEPMAHTPGFVAAVVKGVTAGMPSPEIVGLGLGLLANAIRFLQGPAPVADTPGALAAVVAAMVAHVDTQQVQHTSLVVLGNVAINGQLPADLVAATPGVLPAIAAAMHAHASDVPVQLMALRALTSLTGAAGDGSDRPPVSPATVASVAAEGSVVRAVVGAMTNHAGNAEVQGWALHVLASVAGSGTDAATACLRHDGVLAATLAAVGADPPGIGVRNRGLKLLRCAVAAATADPECATLLRSRSTADLVLAGSVGGDARVAGVCRQLLEVLFSVDP